MRARTCKVCKTKHFNKIIPNICSPQCGFELSKINLQKKKDREFQELKKKVKGNNRQHQLDLTQTVFNKLRKLQEYKWFSDRGLEPECISCGKTKMDWCCGHLKTRKAHSELAFDVNNTFLQCNRYCNKGLSGNLNGNKTSRGYLAGLIERFGQEEGQRIIDYCESFHPDPKWTCEEIKEMRKDFNKQIRELENN